MSDRLPLYEYHVDPDDALTFVSDAWVAFARENDAPHLTREHVIGRPLWHFITDRQTRHLYELLLEQARRVGQVLRLPFRCDAPDCRRFMELDIIAREHGGLKFESRLIREEPREPVLGLGLSRGGPGPLLEMCSWCKRIRSGPDTWLDVEELATRHALFEEPVPDISHVVCPTCFERVRATTRHEASSRSRGARKDPPRPGS